MSDINIDRILEGTPHKVALAYLNTLRGIYDEIAPKVRNIDRRLIRVADEYGNTDLKDGIAIGREVAELLDIMSDMAENIDKLDEEVDRLADGKEEVTK